MSTSTPENPPMTVPSADTPMSSASATSPKQTKSEADEEDLKRRLRMALQTLKRREPLEHTYKHLLMNAVVTPRKPTLPKDRMYKKVGAQLRDRVEAFMQDTQGGDPMDRLSTRAKIEEDAMRGAFTLRECKKHEQEALLAATLAAMPRRNGMDFKTRSRLLEGIAMGLQKRERKPKRSSPSKLSMGLGGSKGSAGDIHSQHDELARLKAKQRRQDLARQRREEEHKRREQEMREEEERRARMRETPQQALFRLYEPILKALWDMEFANLGNTNPFRIVIDRDNCAAMGAPDYFTVIEKPMNLTWITEKANKKEYDTLQAFLADVELMIKNGLLYNSDPNNDFHMAAKEMKRKYKKMTKAVLTKLQKVQQSQS